jgi:hypothetical protein
MEERAAASETFWIRDLLPEDLPSARLLLFNYDSTAYNDAPQVKLKDLATELQVAFRESNLRTLPEVRKSPVNHDWRSHRRSLPSANLQYLGTRSTYHLLMSQLWRTRC